jgi:hypothetical protein
LIKTVGNRYWTGAGISESGQTAIYFDIGGINIGASAGGGEKNTGGNTGKESKRFHRSD